VILAALTDLVAIANIIHQTGHANLTDVLNVSAVELTDIPHAERYHPMAYLDEMALQRASGAATVIVSRAGAGSISEIGLWKKPSILIPLPESISHDQRINAYSYARTGAAVVIEQENLAPHILVSEIKRITGDAALAQKMSDAAQGFTDPDAARILAEQMLAISLAHVQ
jgi:UDP-N-acetylglucosamine--N-acetylmuramyl-(pentapeptide) pyrophosphoryl-undecaprenol N-acetylglucosamine transferase